MMDQKQIRNLMDEVSECDPKDNLLKITQGREKDIAM